MKGLFEIFSGLKSLFIGMRITLREFFKPTVTVHYPHETLKMPKRFRGHIELVRDDATGRPICYACTLCQKACPSDCITVEGAKLDGAKKKSVTNYILDFTKCSLCGSCVEACRDNAIRYSRNYNLAGLSKEDYVMDLFKKLEEESRAAGFPPRTTATPTETATSATTATPVPPATPAAPEAPATQAQGTQQAPAAPAAAPDQKAEAEDSKRGDQPKT